MLTLTKGNTIYLKVYLCLGLLDMVVMSCGMKSSEMNCGSDGICACQTDLCNSSGKVVTNMFLGMAAMVVAMFFV
jgi:hypothetical protein